MHPFPPPPTYLPLPQPPTSHPHPSPPHHPPGPSSTLLPHSLSPFPSSPLAPVPSPSSPPPTADATIIERAVTGQPRQGVPSIATPVAAAPPSHPPLAERRASRARYRRQTGTPHLHPSPSPPSHYTSITIPPVAIVKPQGFLARGFPPWGAAGVHNHLTLSHASYHQLTRPIVHRWSGTPAVYPHRRRSCRRNRHGGAHDPLYHQRSRHAAGASLLSCRTQGLACSLGAAAEGDVDYWAAQPPPPPQPTPTPPTNRTWHTLSSPGSSRGGDQAPLDRGIHQRHLIP